MRVMTVPQPSQFLYSPLVMDRMTQYLTEIEGPGWSLMLGKTMYAGGRRRVCSAVHRQRHVPQEGFRSVLLATGPLWAVR